jgi:segregation and condensation protein A
MSFSVQIENFEGPIDALLQLIEKRKMSISDVSLADIADDYIKFVQSLEEETLSNTTYFILVASTLTLIKSKSLLPNLELSEEEEGDIHELKRRIELFKVYQEIALKNRKFFSKEKEFFNAKQRKVDVVFSPHDNLKKEILHEALMNIFKEIPQKESKKKEAYIKIAVHIEEMMESLAERVKNTLNFDFDNFVDSQIKGNREEKKVKVYKVVGFLAMLELVKNGILNVLQNSNFDKISLSKPNDVESLQNIN